MKEAQQFAETVIIAKARLGELLAALKPKYVGSTQGTHVKPGKGKPPKQEPSLPPGITKKESHEAQGRKRQIVLRKRLFNRKEKK